MNGLIDLLLVRLGELTEDLRYFHKPSGERRPPQIIHTCLEKKTATWKEGEEFPYVRVAVYRGGFDGVIPQPHHVAVVCGIYTPDSIATGTSEIVELTCAVGNIVTNRSFPPYILKTPVEYVLGSDEPGAEGLQPHPYHFSRFALEFLQT